MPDDKEVDPTRYSRSTGEREELLELSRKLELDQKRSSDASGSSGSIGSISSAVIEDASPAVVTSAKNLALLNSSGEAAKKRRAAYADKDEAKEMAEAAERRVDGREESNTREERGGQKGVAVTERGIGKDDDDKERKESYMAMVLGSGENSQRAERRERLRMMPRRRTRSKQLLISITLLPIPAG